MHVGKTDTIITVEMSAKTEAALILACTAIDQLLDTGTLTPDIREELEYLQPELEKFCFAKEKPHTATPNQRNAVQGNARKGACIKHNMPFSKSQI